MDSHVLSIYMCQNKGEPMQRFETVFALKGLGLSDVDKRFFDRYAVGKGAFSGVRNVSRHVTFISLADIAHANYGRDYIFLPKNTRRNILLSGEVDWEKLIGMEFRVGEATFRGVELCTPCKRPSKLSGKKFFEEAFNQRGGLRAEITLTGIVSRGDMITL